MSLPVSAVEPEQPAMLVHGGRLRQAAAQYGIPLSDWLDLSTGINPQPWPVPPLPAAVWQRLPEDEDGLEAAAARYYGVADPAHLLPVAGSQAAIQCLPTLLPRAAVACVAPLYAEHPHAWQRAGHRVRLMQGGLARALGAMTPYVLLCNPNNPGGEHYFAEQLLDAAAQLQRRGGWLIVDEAFGDADPAHSVAAHAGSEAFPRLIVLRSLGKFFGLAGARVGFVLAEHSLLMRLRQQLGPWTVPGPSREVARLALEDRDWQTRMREVLPQQAARLAQLLAPLGEVRHTALFATLACADPADLLDHFARLGILIRAFPEHGRVRFGLPADEAGWQSLQEGIHRVGT